MPLARLVGTATPLSGGGALSADLTLSCPTCLVLSPAAPQPGNISVTGTINGIQAPFGFLQEYEVAGPGSTNSQTANGISAYGTFSFVAPTAKTYLIACDTMWAGSAALVSFEYNLAVDGVATGLPLSHEFDASSHFDVFPLHKAAALTAGTHTIGIWVQAVGGGSLQTNSQGTMRCEVFG